MGISPGTTICGLADGAAWVVKNAIDKFRDEMEDDIKRLQKPAAAADAAPGGDRPRREGGDLRHVAAGPDCCRCRVRICRPRRPHTLDQNEKFTAEDAEGRGDRRRKLVE